MKYGITKILLALSIFAQGASALDFVGENDENIDKTCLVVAGHKGAPSQGTEQQGGNGLQGVLGRVHLSLDPKHQKNLQYWQTCIHSRIFALLESESSLAFEEVWELVTDNCMSKQLQLADKGSHVSFVKMKAMIREGMAEIWRRSTSTDPEG
jgi:hypothetical protein